MIVELLALAGSFTLLFALFLAVVVLVSRRWGESDPSRAVRWEAWTGVVFLTLLTACTVVILGGE